MRRPSTATSAEVPTTRTLEPVGRLVQHTYSDFLISRQKLRRAEAVQLVRDNRQNGVQTVGFASRPFVLCGLPVKRPPTGALIHERRNGRFLLQVTGHPEYGLPWGQDRLIPIYLATLAIRKQSPRIEFETAAELLDTFGLQQGGAQYRRLIGAFQRLFGATIYFGSDTVRAPAVVFHHSRFNFMREARLWYARDAAQPTLSGDCRNMIELSPDFFREIMDHPIPTDLQAAKALSCAPAALDLFTWLTYRCYIAKGEERIPLFGPLGLANQLGTLEYARPRKFREKLEGWLRLVRAMWPECPACIAGNGRELLVSVSASVLPQPK